MNVSNNLLRMKRLFLIVSLMFVLCAVVDAKDKKEDTYRYELESYNGSMAQDDSKCIVRVWSYGKKEKVTRDVCMKNAVHGILFKGYPAFDNRSTGKDALVPEGYEAHKDYFDKFFNEGDYLQYVQLTNKGMPEPGSVIKISKKEYKVGMLVMISYSALRERLEKDGIIKALDFLF